MSSDHDNKNTNKSPEYHTEEQPHDDDLTVTPTRTRPGKEQHLKNEVPMTASTAPDSTFAYSPPSTTSARSPPQDTQQQTQAQQKQGSSSSSSSPWMGGVYHLRGSDDVETPQRSVNAKSAAHSSSSTTPYTDILKSVRCSDATADANTSPSTTKKSSNSPGAILTPNKMHVAAAARSSRSVSLAVPDSATKQLFVEDPPLQQSPSSSSAQAQAATMIGNAPSPGIKSPSTNEMSKSQKRKARKQMPNLLTHGYFPSTTGTYNPFVSISQHEALDLRRLPMEYRPSANAAADGTSTSALMVGAAAFAQHQQNQALSSPHEHSRASSTVSTPARGGAGGRLLLSTPTPPSSTEGRRQRSRSSRGRKKRKSNDTTCDEEKERYYGDDDNEHDLESSRR